VIERAGRLLLELINELTQAPLPMPSETSEIVSKPAAGHELERMR
jgi:hypothetical protein